MKKGNGQADSAPSPVDQGAARHYKRPMRYALGLWILLIYGCDPVFAARGEDVRAYFQEAFSGAPSLTTWETGYASSKEIRGYPEYELNQDISHIEIARREGRIFVNPDVNEVPDGAYTYILSASGDFELGLIENDIEIGVKHFQMADGRALFSAGEYTKYGERRRLSIKSGTFSRHLLSQPGYSQEKTMKRMEKAFRRLWGVDVTMELETLYADPEIIELGILLKYCAHREFFRLHERTICKHYAPATASCATSAID